jgi:hypothetical protein
VTFAEFTGEPGEAAPRGFRWWRVSPAGELYSAWFDRPWDPNSNEATCALPVGKLGRRAWSKRHTDGVPAPGCTCGFYALHRVPMQNGTEPDPERPWLLDPEGWSGLGAAVVFGVAEAWGRVLIGTEGWRSRYSRALALFVPNASDLSGSERMRLLSERYRIPVTASLESLEAEWAPEPIEDVPHTSTVHSDDLTGGGALEDRPPDRWPVSWPKAEPARRGRHHVSDGLMRTPRHVAAVERLTGPGAKRILELGARAGLRASALAERGHVVVAVPGDFSRVELLGRFDVVGHFGGFGVGSDDDQRGLLRRISRWMEPKGCVLIEVTTPWYGARMSGQLEDAPYGDGAHELAFDADGCRVRVRTVPHGDRADAVNQAVRCYSPADLRLLLEGTDLALDTLEAFAGDGYEAAPSLEAAKLYLARLVRRG